jgi:branched-chain amino acid transport system ATP-binding protein
MGYTFIGCGAISWHGRDITRLAPHRRARDGLGWVPQEREIFPSLTVEENLTVAARPGRWSLAAVYELFPRLYERRLSSGNHLSGGEQQMLAIARALMTNPALLLLDEPLEGLAPIIVEELATALRQMIVDQGVAVILVEQHAEIALSLTDRAIVLERGSIVHRARSQDLLKDHAALDRLIGLRLAHQETIPRGP